MVASRDPNSTQLVTGGRLLGVQFMDLLTRNVPNPCRTFFLYVSGYVTIEEMTGVAPAPPARKHPRVISDDLERTYNKGTLILPA